MSDSRSVPAAWGIDSGRTRARRGCSTYHLGLQRGPNGVRGEGREVKACVTVILRWSSTPSSKSCVTSILRWSSTPSSRTEPRLRGRSGCGTWRGGACSVGGRAEPRLRGGVRAAHMGGRSTSFRLKATAPRGWPCVHVGWNRTQGGVARAVHAARAVHVARAALACRREL